MQYTFGGRKPVIHYLYDPLGRFKFLRATMGLVSAGDEYNRRGDDAFRDLPNIAKFVDNFCVWSDDLAQHLASVRAFLECCRLNCVTLSEAKFEFAKSKVAYGGFIVQPGGVGADPSKAAAIANFPRPTNLTPLSSRQTSELLRRRYALSFVRRTHSSGMEIVIWLLTTSSQHSSPHRSFLNSTHREKLCCRQTLC